MIMSAYVPAPMVCRLTGSCGCRHTWQGRTSGFAGDGDVKRRCSLCFVKRGRGLVVGSEVPGRQAHSLGPGLGAPRERVHLVPADSHPVVVHHAACAIAVWLPCPVQVRPSDSSSSTCNQACEVGLRHAHRSFCGEVLGLAALHSQSCVLALITRVSAAQTGASPLA